MPIRNGLSAGDRGILLSPQKAGSNFGQHSDYAYVYVYGDAAEEEDKLLSINVVTASAFPPAQTAGKVLIDIGQNLRDFGYEEGEFRVSYYFYRPLAGDPESNQYFLSKISQSLTKLLNLSAYRVFLSFKIVIFFLIV